MKKIEAIIRRGKLPEVKQALSLIGIQGITVLEAGGFGQQRGKQNTDSPDDEVFLVPKYKIEVFTTDELLEKAVNTIESICKTGRPGDGKIFILPVEDVLRIRTGERGKTAL